MKKPAIPQEEMDEFSVLLLPSGIRFLVSNDSLMTVSEHDISEINEIPTTQKGILGAVKKGKVYTVVVDLDEKFDFFESELYENGRFKIATFSNDIEASIVVEKVEILSNYVSTSKKHIKKYHLPEEIKVFFIAEYKLNDEILPLIDVKAFL